MDGTTDTISPILGSNLLTAAVEHERLKPKPASSGSLGIDIDALDGGFRYGEITSVAGASGMGKTLVKLRLSSSVLR